MILTHPQKQLKYGSQAYSINTKRIVIYCRSSLIRRASSQAKEKKETRE
jgi:hypothetical protein